ncbi:hypothetical protein KP77_28210 [Jeotgalibacillus alimentarius]|uniref:Uncharacterized protein n=1 Tax=Jeotgalibacillus alimentarius TaxID=135826 RepID=A0A0C2RY32_9BACL|nr:hypothetical protein [Jeotgalibacillus alimentarius]KIL46694.1 hypothetical protein KP77_28210 [Jeotgalibacillus alimentarius]
MTKKYLLYNIFGLPFHFVIFPGLAIHVLMFADPDTWFQTILFPFGLYFLVSAVPSVICFFVEFREENNLKHFVQTALVIYVFYFVMVTLIVYVYFLIF